MKEAFNFYSQSKINLKQAPTFYCRHINSIYYGENSFPFLGPLTEFKRKIKLYKSIGCPYKLCKIYRYQVRYLIRLKFLIVDIFFFPLL